MLSRAIQWLPAALLMAAPTLALANPKGAAPESGRVEAGRAVAAGAFGTAGLPSSQANSCFRCHGFDGQANEAAGFPRLANQSALYLYVSLRDYASGTRRNEIMEPIARALSEQQMKDVATYYAAQEIPPKSDPTYVGADFLQLGGAIAAVGNADRNVQACANCHGPQGGGIPPQFPYLAGQTADYLAAQLHAWRNGDRRSSSTGGIIMELISKRLTDEEIRAVSSYYASIAPDAYGVSVSSQASRENPATGPAGSP